ncbi:hypothetical protein IW262DRAFT_1300465 [Armillaria fumosa]|nr:hypothetical protein IW262DRAFT_1300465 [Armillaria fumosa]
MVAKIAIHLQIETGGQSLAVVVSTGPNSSRLENGIRESIVARRYTSKTLGFACENYTVNGHKRGGERAQMVVKPSKLGFGLKSLEGKKRIGYDFTHRTSICFIIAAPAWGFTVLQPTACSASMFYDAAGKQSGERAIPGAVVVDVQVEKPSRTCHAVMGVERGSIATLISYCATDFLLRSSCRIWRIIRKDKWYLIHSLPNLGFTWKELLENGSIPLETQVVKPSQGQNDVWVTGFAFCQCGQNIRHKNVGVADPHRHLFVFNFHVQVEIMGGIPVVFIGYELEDDALDVYQSSDSPRDAVRSLLHVVESETSRPASIVRYDDSKGQTHKFVCCFADLSGRTYSSKEIDAVPVPAEFFRVPERVKTRGELERKFSPSAMVNSYDADGKTRVDVGAVIG